MGEIVEERKKFPLKLKTLIVNQWNATSGPLLTFLRIEWLALHELAQYKVMF